MQARQSGWVWSSATLHVMHARMWGIKMAARGMSGGVADANERRAPPGALRTAVRRQAGLRTYELPWGYGGTVTFPSPKGSVVVRFVQAADSVTARSPLRGQRENCAKAPAHFPLNWMQSNT